MHRGRDLGKNSRRSPLPATRLLAATGALAVSFSVANLPGTLEPRQVSSATGPTAGSSPASGNGHTAPQPPRPATEAAGVVLRAPDGFNLGSEPHGVPSEPHAVLQFPRPMVTGSAPDTPALPAVGLSGIVRPAAGFLMAPLQLLIPSSPFGFRISPLTGTAGDFHLGQDYAAPCGTSVYAADSGVVRAAGWHPWGGGNRVEIDHGNGLVTTYNHLESVAVRRGDDVQVGQIVGRVGSTGWSTGCHLHFETILNGAHVSPLKWRLVGLKALAGGGTPDLYSYTPGSGSPGDEWLNWTPPGIKSTAPLLPEAEAETTTARSSAESGTASTPSPPSPAGSSTPFPQASESPGAPSPSLTDTTPSPSPSPTGTTPSPSPTGTTPSPSPTDTTPSPSPTPDEPGPSPTDPAATPTEPAPPPTEATPTPTDSTPPPTETTPPATEPVPPSTDPAPAPVEPAPSPVEPAPSPVEPAPSPVKPAPSPVESAPSPVEPAPSPVESAPSPVEPAPSPVKPTPSPVAPAPSITPTTDPLPAEPTSEPSF
ncbi:M23 family peptidase [Pseudarthrobacter sp. NamE2]|nr:M23 family peptidase [Pseudarthrobacter sp. NamE2]